MYDDIYPKRRTIVNVDSGEEYEVDIGSDGRVIKKLKNRMYPPFQQATIDIGYKTGLNEWAGIMDLAVEAEIIKKAGGWYTYGTDKVQGEDKAKEWLPQIPGLVEKLDKWLENTGYSTISMEVKEAEALIQEAEQFEPEPESSTSKPTMKKKTVKRSLIK